MKLGNICAECGGIGAGPRQLCAGCEPLYPLTPGKDVAQGDECPCPTCRSDLALIAPCQRHVAERAAA